jgi:hypothetical protein
VRPYASVSIPVWLLWSRPAASGVRESPALSACCNATPIHRRLLCDAVRNQPRMLQSTQYDCASPSPVYTSYGPSPVYSPYGPSPVCSLHGPSPVYSSHSHYGGAPFRPSFDDSSEYSSFAYWQEPAPDVFVDTGSQYMPHWCELGQIAARWCRRNRPYPPCSAPMAGWRGLGTTQP